MAVFDWVESPNTSLPTEPRVRRTQFGDGYAETAPDGLNPITQVWSLTFREVENAIADDMVAFWKARVSPVLGLEPFDWTPRWSTTPIKVECIAWTRTVLEVHGCSDLTATFRQVHLP